MTLGMIGSMNQYEAYERQMRILNQQAQALGSGGLQNMYGSPPQEVRKEADSDNKLLLLLGE